MRGDPYETSDAVFGVKESLIVTLREVGDVEGLAERHGVLLTTKLLRHDFVLTTEEESLAVRQQDAQREVERQGGGLKVVGGLLVPDKHE